MTGFTVMENTWEMREKAECPEKSLNRKIQKCLHTAPPAYSKSPVYSRSQTNLIKDIIIIIIYTL